MNGHNRHSYDPFAFADAAAQASITSSALRQFIAFCRSSLPDEACGVLAFDGAKQDGSETALPPGAIHVNTVYPIRNAALRPSGTFEFDPKDWVRVLYEMQKNRQSLVGFYHSHPRSAPVPSAADFDGLRHLSAQTCWIISFADPSVPLVNPYRISEGVRLVPLMLAQIGV